MSGLSATNSGRRFAPWSLLLLTILVGCKVGPNYRPPMPYVPETWSQETPPEIQLAPQYDLTDTSWWTVFCDPALDHLIFEAANTNLELVRTGVRIAESQAQRAVIRGDLFPRISGTGAYSRVQISNNGNPFGISASSVGGFPGFQPFDLYTTGFDASWELDLFGRIRRAVEAADAQIGVAIEDHRAVAVALFAEMASNYVELRTTQEQIDLAYENARIQRETVQFVQNRFDAGAGTELDVAQALSTLRNTEAAIPLLQARARQTMNRLCVLRAQYPRDLEPELGRGPIPSARPDIVIGLPVSLIRQRPDVRRAEREIASQSARVGVAVADLYPDVSLLGVFTVDSVDITRWFTTDSIAYRLTGPSVRWQIVQFGRIRNNIRVQDARLEQAMIGYEQTLLTAVEEVENVLVAYLEQRERTRLLEQAAEAARRAEELQRSLLEGGRTDVQSLLEVQRFRLLIEEQATAARGTLAQNLISLYRAMGGGWQYAPFLGMAFEMPGAVEPTPVNGEELLPGEPTPAVNGEDPPADAAGTD